MIARTPDAGFRWRVRWCTAVALLLVSWHPWAAQMTAAEFSRVTLELPGGTLEAALADTPRLRGIGYQRSAVGEAPAAIYFRYPSSRRVHFHMRNVPFPVRAYWIGPNDCVIGYSDMEPGESGYRPPAPVIGVLEVAAFARGVPALKTGHCLEVRFSGG